ncbi:MAG TPA: diacylglycerol kinase family protein [Blastocatellia bacterium]|nr:diacylglycerol kinase family protein [Blastocatellia bacterium]
MNRWPKAADQGAEVITTTTTASTVFIINPASGRGSALDLWKTVKRRISSAGVEFREYIADGPGSAERLARDAVYAGVNRVIAVGGDGTLNEAVNGYLADSGQPVNAAASLALIPAGTGSDFRRSVALQTIEDALRTLCEGRTHQIDAGMVRYHLMDGKTVNRFFLNVVSFGLGGRVSATVNRWRSKLSRKLSGQFVFSAAAVAGLADYKLHNVSISMDDLPPVNARSDLLVVANGRFAGSGMMLAPIASLDDGLLDVVVTDGAGRLDVIKELRGIRRGDYVKNPKVRQYRAREITKTPDCRMPIDIDGESGGFTPARLRVLPGVIKFCVPHEIKGGSQATLYSPKSGFTPDH